MRTAGLNNQRTKERRNRGAEEPRNRENPFFRSRQGRDGQALVGLLSFMAVGVIVISAAVVTTLVNTQTTSSYFLGERNFSFAESGAEDANLRLLRNPNFVNSTTTYSLFSPTVSVILGVSGASSKTIAITAQFDGLIRKFQATGSFSGTVYTPSTLQEIAQ